MKDTVWIRTDFGVHPTSNIDSSSNAKDDNRIFSRGAVIKVTGRVEPAKNKISKKA